MGGGLRHLCPYPAKSHACQYVIYGYIGSEYHGVTLARQHDGATRTVSIISLRIRRLSLKLELCMFRPPVCASFLLKIAEN